MKPSESGILIARARARVRACVRACVCVCVCVPSLVCMVGAIFVYADTVFGFYGHFMLSLTFQHD